MTGSSPRPVVNSPVVNSPLVNSPLVNSPLARSTLMKSMGAARRCPASASQTPDPLLSALGVVPSEARCGPNQAHAGTRLLVIPMRALHALVALLCLDGQGGDRTGLEAAQADRLRGFLAI